MGMATSASDWAVFAVILAVIGLLLFMGYRNKR